MGANAQTTVPTFTASQVLTADQMNQSARTGVPVFADTTARDAAFGGSGEKTLAEGQLCYLESTNVVQYYDGAAWATVGPATPGGLVYLTGATFTTATSVSLPNNTFSSTYRNYKVILQLTALTADADFSLRFRAAGSDDTNTSYRSANIGINSVGTQTDEVGNAQSSIDMGESDSGSVWYSTQFDVIAPQVATVTTVWGNYGYVNKAATTGFTAMNLGGNFGAATQFDSLTFISSVASSMTGIYRVYGYADS